MQVMSAFDPEIMTRYEVFGTGGTFERPFVTKAESLEKRMRGPLDYEIGYDDDNGSIGMVFPLFLGSFCVVYNLTVSGTVPSVMLVVASSFLVVLLQRRQY